MKEKPSHTNLNKHKNQKPSVDLLKTEEGECMRAKVDEFALGNNTHPLCTNKQPSATAMAEIYFWIWFVRFINDQTQKLKKSTDVTHDKII